MSQDTYSDDHTLKILGTKALIINATQLNADTKGIHLESDNDTIIDSANTRFTAESTIELEGNIVNASADDSITLFSPTTRVKGAAVVVGDPTGTDQVTLTSANVVGVWCNEFNTLTTEVNMQAGKYSLGCTTDLEASAGGSMLFTSDHDVTFDVDNAFTINAATLNIPATTSNGNASFNGSVSIIGSTFSADLFGDAYINTDTGITFTVGDDDKFKVNGALEAGDADTTVRAKDGIGMFSNANASVKVHDSGLHGIAYSDNIIHLESQLARFVVSTGNSVSTTFPSMDSWSALFVNRKRTTGTDGIKVCIGTDLATNTTGADSKFLGFYEHDGLNLLAEYTDPAVGSLCGAITGDDNGGVLFSSSFTGAHACVMNKSSEPFLGAIVTASGKIWMQKISISQATPKVDLSGANSDKSVYGVVAELSPKNYAGYVRHNGLDDDEICVSINSVGDGRVWVTNIKGEVGLGDYITSSLVRGYGCKQEDDLMRSSTVAKCTELIDWDGVEETIEHDGVSLKRYLSACTYHCG